METYALFKHSHLLFAVISISLFVFRATLKFRGSQLLETKVLKISPHINDTLLLASGITLAVLAGFSPMAQPWLATKIILLIVYIGLGTVVIKKQLSGSARAAVFVAALVCFAAIGSSAVSKAGPFGLF
ncbi:SirB2 family protein [Umboniibacter marinipuniceus]|uniref:Putative membrane protein SirB2 n=1 Tax=Umboniibacter marinipuniceus TaxID=569599 RepID=A0A3M0A8S3_9GAMM|nr:SirB2 family protein [Umboniibacter marinipuniceus]RMA78815.1 putative membrane protein SirB2 [Umboniibacter marinipuniceus]